MIEGFLYKQVGEELKTRAKAQGITQARIASDLNVSIPTVKRWYAGQSLTLPSIQRLTEYLGVSLGEFFSNLENDKNCFEYTLKQEQFLVKNPASLAFFDQLVRGRSVKQIKNQFKIKENDINFILLSLDRIKLIELHQDNKVKLLNKGEPRWRKSGPLAKRFKAEIIESFLNGVSDKEATFYLHEYLWQDKDLIKKKIEDLKQFLVLANKKANRSNEAKVSYGTYIASNKFDWKLTDLLK